MSDWVGLFGNYETVGKQLKAHKTETLNRRQSESETLSPHRAVIQINSTYLELIDRWNYQRGFITILSIVTMIISFGFLFLIIYFGFFDSSPNSSVGNTIMGIVFLIVFLGILWGSWHFFRRECFSYTHYPIRFNRKLKKVYVIQPNKKLLVANWEDFHIGLQQYSRSRWDVRFSFSVHDKNR